jgi:uncharacterized membrane protein YeaQ/YmgE (transglycosylase-associated protein family)
MLALAAFILVGLIVATIAKALVPGRDPGVGITILLGTVAQVVVWFGSRFIFWDFSAQPWSFFLSIAAAAALLRLYRDSGLDEMLGPGAPRAAGVSDATPLHRSPKNTRSIWSRLALTPPWAAAGAMLLGVTGFVIGFFGPMQFQPWANQGPMVGIFLTGPGGVLLGAVSGGALAFTRPDWPTRRRVWVLNAVNVAWGLFVLDLVVDRSWWH